MARNAIEREFWTSHILYIFSDIQNGHRKKFLYRSEMARIAIESEFRKSKMPIDLKWPEMRSKVNFGHPKWPT